MTDEMAEYYIERPEFFEEGQTTLDGYVWRIYGNLYIKEYRGCWNERSH